MSYLTIMYGGLGVGVVFLLCTIFLFFYLDIPLTIGELTGHVQKMEQEALQRNYSQKEDDNRQERKSFFGRRRNRLIRKNRPLDTRDLAQNNRSTKELEAPPDGTTVASPRERMRKNIWTPPEDTFQKDEFAMTHYEYKGNKADDTLLLTPRVSQNDIVNTEFYSDGSKNHNDKSITNKCLSTEKTDNDTTLLTPCLDSEQKHDTTRLAHDSLYDKSARESIGFYMEVEDTVVHTDEAINDDNY